MLGVFVIFMMDVKKLFCNVINYGNFDLFLI